MKWTKVLCTPILGLAFLLSGEVPQVEAIVCIDFTRHPVPWVPFPWPGSVIIYDNLLQNPGFDSDSNGAWSEYSSEGRKVIDSRTGAYRGRYHAWLNGHGKETTEGLSQQVTIPAEVPRSTLSFYLRINTAETGSAVSDTLRVRIYEERACTTGCAPELLAELAQYSNVDATPNYRYHEFDVTSFKGKTIIIAFEGHENDGLQTSFHLDSVDLTGPVVAWCFYDDLIY